MITSKIITSYMHNAVVYVKSEMFFMVTVMIDVFG